MAHMPASQPLMERKRGEDEGLPAPPYVFVSVPLAASAGYLAWLYHSSKQYGVTGHRGVSDCGSGACTTFSPTHPANLYRALHGCSAGYLPLYRAHGFT